jgi:hypothetical protein
MPLILDGVSIGFIQRFDFWLPSLNHSALLTQDYGSAVQLLLHGIADDDLSPTQATRAIPCMVAPGAKAFVICNP